MMRGRFARVRSKPHFMKLVAVTVTVAILVIIGLTLKGFSGGGGRQQPHSYYARETQVWRELMEATGERGSALICGGRGEGMLYYHPHRWLCHLRACSLEDSLRPPLVYRLTNLHDGHLRATRVPFGGGSWLAATLGDEFPASFVRWKREEGGSSSSFSSVSLSKPIGFPGWYVYDERPYYLQDLFGLLITQRRYTCSAYVASDFTLFNLPVKTMMDKFPFLILMGASPQVGEGGTLPSTRLLPIPAAEGHTGERRWPKGIPQSEWKHRWDILQKEKKEEEEAASRGGGGVGTAVVVDRTLWLVRWRGVTTGRGSNLDVVDPIPCGTRTFNEKRFDYNMSDRWIAVRDADAGAAPVSPTSSSASTLFPPMLDLKFTGAVQNVLRKPASYFGSPLKPNVQLSTSLFMLDIDGNSNAWSSLRWKICSGMPVFKVDSSVGFVEWFYKYLVNGTNILLLSPLDPIGDMRRWLGVGNATFFANIGRNGAKFCDEYISGEGQYNHMERQFKDLWLSVVRRQTTTTKRERRGRGGDVVAAVGGGDVSSNTSPSYSYSTLLSSPPQQGQPTTSSSWLPKGRSIGNSCWLP